MKFQRRDRLMFRVTVIRRFINVSLIDHAVAARGNFFHHARNNEISAEKAGRYARSHACDGISRLSTIHLQYRISRKASATQFFSFPIQRSIDLSAPSDAQRFVRKKPLLLGDLLPSRWSRCTSGRRPFRIYNFLLEEIDFQLALQFHSNAHGSPIRNFSPRKFVLAS